MRFLVIDTESGGLDPLRNALLEIGAVVVDESLNEIASFEALVAPAVGMTVEKTALDINHIDLAEVEKYGPSENQALHAFRDFVERYQPYPGPFILAGWNVALDIAMLKAALERQCCSWWPFSHKTLDIQAIWAFCQNWDFGGLKNASKKVRGIGVEHRALPDARLSLDILRALKNVIGSVS